MRKNPWLAFAALHTVRLGMLLVLPNLAYESGTLRHNTNTIRMLTTHLHNIRWVCTETEQNKVE